MRTPLPALVVVGLLACACTSTPPSVPQVAPTKASVPTQGPRVIRITAQKFEYSPEKIVLKKGEPVVLELVSLDRKHGFAAPDFGLRADIEPEKVARLEFVPDKLGTFGFHCDVFCGSGHEDMSGEIVVEE